MRTPEQDLHRPRTFEGLTSEALRLARDGFTPRDIAEMLHLTPPAVEAMLRDSGGTPHASRAAIG